jgi:cytolysin (calcineurin-like family phosphatase)
MSNGNLPLDVLEQRAAEQRNRIHQSVDDLKQLKTSVTENVRETLDVNRQARQHFWTAAGAASLVALVFGYALAGVFVD